MPFLLVISFLAGILTLLSPCILPILPIMLSGAIGGKWRPYGILTGFIFTFSIFTLFLTALVSSLGIDLDHLRLAAAIILIVTGLILIIPKLHEWVNQLLPQFSVSKTPSKSGFIGGLLTGIPLGLIWAPCAGPILASVITLAAISKAGFSSFLVIFAYSLGVALVMLLIILGSRRVLEKIKNIRQHLKIIQGVFGLIIILTGIAMATGYDRKIQTYIVAKTPSGWTRFLQKIEDNKIVRKELNKLKKGSEAAEESKEAERGEEPDDALKAPELRGIVAWINSEPLTLKELRGKVVLVDFWTYSCINCIRTLPYLQQWYAKYIDDGLVIIGVHSPEFAFEKKLANVQKAVKDFQLEYPIALDNDFATWQAYENHYWPAKYLINRQGNIVYTHFGEGDYEATEMKIRELLEATGAKVTDDITKEDDNSSYARGQTPETYLGYQRRANFANEKELKKDEVVHYTLQENLKSHQWTLDGPWLMKEKDLIAKSSPDSPKFSQLRLKFNAKEVYLVMGSDDPNGLPVTVTLNGQILSDQLQEGNVRGEDVIGHDFGQEGENYTVLVKDYRLYRLIKSDKFLKDAVLALILPAGVTVNAFTFGS